MPGGKCSCTMKLAVRVEKAFPPLERRAPLAAFAKAATPVSTVSRPRPLAPSTGWKRVRAGAPSMRSRPRERPSASTTEMFADNPTLAAPAAAWARMRETSSAVRASSAARALGVRAASRLAMPAINTARYRGA